MSSPLEPRAPITPEEAKLRVAEQREALKDSFRKTVQVIEDRVHRLDRFESTLIKYRWWAVGAAFGFALLASWRPKLRMRRVVVEAPPSPPTIGEALNVLGWALKERVPPAVRSRVHALPGELRSLKKEARHELRVIQHELGKELKHLPHDLQQRLPKKVTLPNGTKIRLR